MSHWSLVPEFISLLFIIVIMLFFYDKHRVRTFRRSLFWGCLWTSIISILLNVAGAYLIAYPHLVSLEFNTLINTLYFWSTVLMCSVVAMYLFHKMLEYVYDKHCLKRAFIGLSSVVAMYTLLAIWNLKSGVLFYFDSAGVYHRGIYNRIGYLGLLIEVFMLVMCYIRNRRSISKKILRVIQIVIPIALILAGLQVTVLRALYLNGTIIALVNLVIFINFQSHPIEADSLTGLGNRKSFLDEIKLRTAGHQQYQIICISLNNFGMITRKLGYSVGDGILHEVAQFFSSLHPEGRAYRITSVSFAVLLPLQHVAEQEVAIEKIQNRFEKTWQVGRASCTLPFHGASLLYQLQPWTAEQVMVYLEYTLAQAKNAEKQMLLFDDQIEKRYQRREHLIHTMQRAIADRRFQVYYQPVYNCKTRLFDTAEALVRLTDYNGDPLSPGEFIPLAEETRMIDDISWIVIEKVCALMGEDGVPGLKQISINLSVQQFMQKDLVERIETLMKRYHTPAEALRFEITESAILDDETLVRNVMEQMKAHGFTFYLDDFGTGYSNFSRVQELPFEVIKLDRSLLLQHPSCAGAQALPDVLLPYFHSLGHIVVAEGVETTEQMDWMMRIGVDRIQGFYFARPMTEENLRALFHEQHRKQVNQLNIPADSSKKVAVRYFASTHSNASLAFSVAEAVGVSAEPISVDLAGPVDVLFLGSFEPDDVSAEEQLQIFLESNRSKYEKVVRL